MRKKILLVTHNLNLEGASYSCFYLARGLKNNKFDISILSPIKGVLFKKYKYEGIPIKIINFFRKRNIFSFFNLYFFLKKGNFNIIYVNTFLNWKFILLYTIFNFKSKIVWCIRESNRKIYFNRCKHIKKLIFSKADKVLFVSKATNKVYEDLNKKNNFYIIPNGIDINEIKEYKKNNAKAIIKKKLGFNKNSIIISIIGTLCPRKGQLEFTKAAISLLDEIEHNYIYFLMVGGRGDKYQKKIENIIHTADNRDKIIIIPETEKVFDYYLITDLFICNSSFESFPRIILEAMAFKLPIISTNVFGIKEQIENNKSGLLIEPGNILMLKAAIKKLLNNKSIAKKVSDNAYKKCVNNFNYNKSTDRHIKLFNDL